MLSTTSLIQKIQTDLKRLKPLQNYLPNLIQSIGSSKKIVLKNMNNKQKLSQLQQMMLEEIKNIQKSLTQINIDLDLEDENQDIENRQEQGLSSQNQEEDSQNQYEEDMELQGDENQGQQEEQQIPEEQEFDQQQEIDQQNQQEQPLDEQQNEQMQNEDQQLQDQGEQEQQQAENQQQDQPLDSNEEDIGLYGQQLNDQDQDMQDYQNQFDQEQFNQFEKQYGDKDKKNKKQKKSKNHADDQVEDNIDQNIEDNFDHFRQVQMENHKEELKAQQKTDLDRQIDQLEDKIIAKKDWTMKGQVKGRQRPSNSLLQFDLQFSSGIKYTSQITEQKNSELEQLIKKRILNQMFDDRTRFVNTSHIRQHFGSLKQVSRQKSQMGLGELYQSQFKNFLGIGDNKNDKLKGQIMDSFKQLNYYLDSLSNFSFTPKPTKQNTKNSKSQAIIVQQKVPLTLWNGQRQTSKQGKLAFESQKQVNNQAKRLKNKRIARQRKKQQMKKKLNKKIEYGGMTKFQAQAKQKAIMNNKGIKVDGANMKYNKSSSFFKNINQNKGGKPNPNISKMKI